MLELEFRINQEYLLVHTLAQESLPFPEWEKLKNKISEKYPEAAALIFHPFKNPAVIFEKNYEKNPLDFYSDAKKAMKKAMKLKEFRKLYSETEEYAKIAAAQWSKNKEKAINLLEEISGLKTPDKKIIVFTTHPNFLNSRALDENTIVLGHMEEYENCATIHLCHTLAHIMTKMDKSVALDALIELMTDNEIRVRLNEKGDYFEYSHHNSLTDYIKEILPEWQEYLQDKKGLNIVSLAEKLKKI